MMDYSVRNLYLFEWKSIAMLYVNKSPTRCNSMQSALFYCKITLCFGCPPHPSSGELKTVTAASGTNHNIGTATSLQRGQVGTGPELATLEGYYDQYRRLRLQFLVLLMMTEVDTRNM